MLVIQLVSVRLLFRIVLVLSSVWLIQFRCMLIISIIGSVSRCVRLDRFLWFSNGMCYLLVFFIRVKLVCSVSILCIVLCKCVVFSLMLVLCVVRCGVMVGVKVSGLICLQVSVSEYWLSNINVLLLCRFCVVGLQLEVIGFVVVVFRLVFWVVWSRLVVMVVLLILVLVLVMKNVGMVQEFLCSMLKMMWQVVGSFLGWWKCLQVVISVWMCWCLVRLLGCLGLRLCVFSVLSLWVRLCRLGKCRSWFLWCRVSGSRLLLVVCCRQLVKVWK